MTATLAFHPTTLDYSFFGGNAEVLVNGNVEYDECAATPLPSNNGAIFEVTKTSPPTTVWEMHDRWTVRLPWLSYPQLLSWRAMVVLVASGVG